MTNTTHTAGMQSTSVDMPEESKSTSKGAELNRLLEQLELVDTLGVGLNEEVKQVAREATMGELARHIKEII